MLVGIATGEPHEAMNAIDDGLSLARASILDVHLFSGVHVSFVFELHGSDAAVLGEALSRAHVALDDASLERLREADGLDRTFTGSLAVTFAHGDPDLRREVPDVPG